MNANCTCDGAAGLAWWNAMTDHDREFWMLASLGASPADAWKYFKRCGAAGMLDGVQGDRRAAVRQTNLRRRIADTSADARRLREVVERMAGAAQPVAQSDLQALLALARITEFHAVRAARSVDDVDAIAFLQESAPCL